MILTHLVDQTASLGKVLARVSVPASVDFAFVRGWGSRIRTADESGGNPHEHVDRGDALDLIAQKGSPTR